MSALRGRVQWALGRIAELVNAGRAAGWLAGQAAEHVTHDDRFRGNGPDGSPMQLLGTRLQLSEQELDALWLLACIDIEPHVSHAAQLLMGAGMHEVSVQIVERLLARGAMLGSQVFERLDSLALIEMSWDASQPLYRRSIRATDRVLDLVRGDVAVDRALRDFATLSTALDIRRTTIDFGLETSPELARALEAADIMIVATGREGSGRATMLRHAVSSTGRSVLTVRASELAPDLHTMIRQLRAITRECQLHDAWPLLTDVDVLADRLQLVERELFARHRGPVLATAREVGLWTRSRRTMTLSVPMPDARATRALWERALPAANEEVTAECASRYILTPAVIARTAATAVSLVVDPRDIGASHVHVSVRAHVEKQVSGLARRIETTQTWDDLVLPVEQFDLLIELVARVRHRQQVLDQWGFAAKVGRGLGTSALFSGPPGTGKTMIAGLVAKELGLDLYQVDLSKVVSKYIGETEKQLAALFEAAESGHAILLFDEADSLFAKRTEVKSSNDRYANLEVNYLLQRIEAFSGITILTTNHESAIDPAFLRRLAFHVCVPLPDERQRELLWKCMMPEQAECAAVIDFGGLATRFEMSGGYIKNAVLRAAFLSADQNTAITNEHLWRAARAEYEAMGKLAL